MKGNKRRKFKADLKAQVAGPQCWPWSVVRKQ